MNGNYIKINRSMLEWEWYSDINTTRLFIHLILRANWKDGKFKGSTVPRGSLISSFRKLAEETLLTEREVRTAISHLKTTGEVTHKGHSKYSVFTVVNYDRYQYTDTQEDEQETGNRHSNDILTTTIEEGKKGRRKEGNINTSFPPSGFDFLCVEKIIKSCLDTVANAKVPETEDAKHKWAVEIERMRRLDKRTEQEITTALDYALSDSFWKPNIRSAGKFREKFETLYAQQKRGNTTKPVSKNLNNFERRKYDMDSLEEQLLGR
ncbi:MAG: hypothetical protein QM793_03520 [Muricomes sp.]